MKNRSYYLEIIIELVLFVVVALILTGLGVIHLEYRGELLMIFTVLIVLVHTFVQKLFSKKNET